MSNSQSLILAELCLRAQSCLPRFPIESILDLHIDTPCLNEEDIKQIRVVDNCCEYYNKCLHLLKDKSINFEKIQKPKVFMVGMNKMATTYSASYVRKCGFSSYTRPDWARLTKTIHYSKHSIFDKYDFYSDGNPLHIPPYFFFFIDKLYSSAFILQLRPLAKWLISRYNHKERGKYVGSLDSDNSFLAILYWILERDINSRRFLHLALHLKSTYFFNINNNFPELFHQICVDNDFKLPYFRKVSNKFASAIRHEANVFNSSTSYDSSPSPVLDILNDLNLNPNSLMLSNAEYNRVYTLIKESTFKNQIPNFLY